MWSPDPKFFGKEYDASLFLLTVWNELFDPFTPDTFQPRHHNTASLINELYDISSRDEKATPWWKHITEIRDELRKTAVSEQDLLKDIPEYQWQIKQILKLDSAKSIRLKCQMLIERREEYNKSILSSIRNSALGLPQQKFTAYKSLRRLATLAIQSLKEDDDVLANLPLPTESPKFIIESLINLTLHESQAYDCVFAVVGKQSDIQRITRPIGFQLIRVRALPKLDVESLRSVHPEVHFVHITTDGTSIRDAIIKSRNSLSVGVDIFNLYRNSATIKVLDQVFLRTERAHSYSSVNMAEQAFRRLYPRARAAQDSLAALEMVSRSRLERRVLSALELHSLALASPEPRTKFANLWSALECLAGCSNKGKIIARVTELVVPLLVWRRVDKVIRYTAIGVHEFGDIRGNHSYGSGFDRSNDKFVHPWDMMTTLCRPEDHPDISGLLIFCGDHPLLSFRVFQLWKEFTNPDTLRKKLLTSQQRIEWQLLRIYRARNLLVHDGVEVTQLGSLLDNLQYYSTVALQRIIHGMKIGKNWGVSESVEYWSAKSAFVLDTLKTSPEKLRVSDFFPIESHEPAPHLWS